MHLYCIVSFRIVLESAFLGKCMSSPLCSERVKSAITL